MPNPLFLDRNICARTAQSADTPASRSLLIAGLAITAFAMSGVLTPLHAQSGATGPQDKRIASIRFGTNGSDPEGTRDPKQRTLDGKVQDPNGKAIKGAIVYLKDKHDNSMRSMAVDDSGSYHFVQLAQSRDYEVWAQVDKKKGAVRVISSFDEKMDINLNLKVQ